MKKIALSLLMIFLCVFCAWSVSYGIEEYFVQVIVGKNAVHFVNEDIAMNFYTPGHGFYRDIPYKFTGSPVTARITDVECSENFTHESSDGYYSMKIGNENKTVSGLNNYNISYSYDLGEDLNEGYDEFYMDLLGNGWECPTDSFGFAVFIPEEGLNTDDLFISATSGRYGSGRQVDYLISEYMGYYVILGSVENLRAGEAVTLRVELPDHWYEGARQMWDVTSVFKILAPYISIVLVVIAFILWLAYGKDKQPIIMARFEEPEGFSPMVVGYLADGSVDDKDIISMIFNWADRGLLKINEQKKNKFSFTKTAEIEDSAPKAERDLFNAFFRGCGIDGTLSLSDLQRNNFAQAMLNAKVNVSKYFTKERKLNSKKAGVLGVLIGFFTPIPLILMFASRFMSEYSIAEQAALSIVSVFIALMSILFQWLVFRKWYLRRSNIVPVILAALPCVLALAVGFAVCGSWIIPFTCSLSAYLLALFTIIMGKRSEYGQKMLEEVLGYREFIEKAEVDELKMMIEKDPQLYYKKLSYAIVLGLEDTWAKKFEGIAIAQPTWYVGVRPFDVIYFSNMAGRMRTVVAANSVAQAAGKGVGGGGFHSTGFAGGGFGGGGGHAW